MEFSLPLRVRVSKKKFFILNLNNYRNAHHRVLSSAKRGYTDIVLDTLADFDPLPRYKRIKVHYKVFPASNRRYDGNNVVSIVDKFLMDALVKKGVIPDDNIAHVACYHWLPMPPDKDNPRIEVHIEDLDAGGGFDTLCRFKF